MAFLASFSGSAKSRLTIFAAASLVVFVAGGAVGLWTAYDSALSWPIFLTLLASVGLLLVIPRASALLWAKILTFAAGLIALYFISQYAHFNYKEEVGFLARLGQLTGSLAPAWVVFTPHPNAVAGFIEGALLVCLALIGQADGKSRWGWAVLAALMAYGLLISASRGAWLGLAVAISLWLLLIFREWAWQLVMLGLGLMMGLGAGAYGLTRLTPPGQRVFILSSALDTAHSRLTLYYNSWQLLKDYPFTGIGLGDTFAMVYSRYQLLLHVPYLYYAHNLFLAVALGQGVLGLLGLIGLLLAFYGFVVRVERADLEEQALTLFRAAWLGVTVSLVHGLTDAVQYSQDFWTMPMLFALAGVAIGVGQPALAQTGQTAGAQPKAKSYIKWLAAGAIVLLLVGLFFGQPVAAVWQANLGAVYQTKADLSPSLDESARQIALMPATAFFQRALSFNPDQPTANRRLGLIALDRREFDPAVTYLERAYTQEPHNQATLKILGYAYLWTGQFDRAEACFRQLDFSGELVKELSWWQWWWGTQERPQLAEYAGEMAQRLAVVK